MAYLITPADLASFGRCHRQWDFGARARQNLEPLRQPEAASFGVALRNALAIYYFPGMWDWQRQVTLPLVLQGFQRSLVSQREQRGVAAGDALWQQWLDGGRRLLERYFEWAPALDRFAPVLVETEYEAALLDPARPEFAVVAADGEPIRYRGLIDMLAVDGNDAYWIVRHRLVEGDWTPVQALIDDEEAVAACWAWEQFYLGMAIAGTIHNEVRLDVPAQPQEAGRPDSRPRTGGLRRWLPKTRRDGASAAVRQHEPSGGGRSIPQHRRMYAVARETGHGERVEQHTAPHFRRTWVRRDRAEITQAWHRVAARATEMVRPDVSVQPSPSPALCAACAYLAPCQAMTAGDSTAPLLRLGYRERLNEKLVEGRLGGGAWSTGRGAAPPRFRGAPDT